MIDSSCSHIEGVAERDVPAAKTNHLIQWTSHEHRFSPLDEHLMRVYQRETAHIIITFASAERVRTPGDVTNVLFPWFPGDRGAARSIGILFYPFLAEDRLVSESRTSLYFGTVRDQFFFLCFYTASCIRQFQMVFFSLRKQPERINCSFSAVTLTMAQKGAVRTNHSVEIRNFCTHAYRW